MQGQENVQDRVLCYSSIDDGDQDVEDMQNNETKVQYDCYHAQDGGWFRAGVLSLVGHCSTYPICR